MRTMILVILVGLFTISAQATYKKSTVKQIQTVSADSLLKLDSLGIGAAGSWTKQTSPLIHISGATQISDSVEITVLVVVPHHVITYTGHGKTMIVADTGSAKNDPWSHILVRFGGTEASFDADGYNSVQKGDIITIKGQMSEFPASNTSSLTQFAPDTNEALVIVSNNNALPTVPHKQISDFNIGNNPGGKTMFSTGEPWESEEVMFTNVVVTGSVNITRGTWAFVDQNGNTMSMYDWSYHFTLDTTATDRVGNLHDKNYKPFVNGQKIDTLRGFIGTASGTESNRAYRLCPIYPEDAVKGLTLPAASTHRRYPVIPTQDSIVMVQAKAFQQFGGFHLSSVKLVYKVGNGAWIESTMVAKQASVDSLYNGYIPKQSVGSYIYYFIKATDDSSNVTLLANARPLSQADTAQGLFFYRVLDRTSSPVLSIRDVQYTPFRAGYTSYLGAVDSVGGIVTADTSSLFLVSGSGSVGTNAWYIQSGNQPWSGIHVGGPDSVLNKIHLGDSVVVKGTLTEFNDVTEVFPVTAARVVSSGNALPSPVVLSTAIGQVANGDTSAEPYEGMLVRFNGLTVSDVNPTFTEPTEFLVTDGSKAIIVRRDGRNTYSNVLSDTALGYTILRLNNKIASLTGIIYYSQNHYKITPRKNADYGTVTGVDVRYTDFLPKEFALMQNFPNPFNPTTTIRFAVPVAGMVSLKVYNVLGQEVATLVQGERPAGTYDAMLDASRLASGLYLYRLTAGTFSQVKKMLLIK